MQSNQYLFYLLGSSMKGWIQYVPICTGPPNDEWKWTTGNDIIHLSYPGVIRQAPPHWLESDKKVPLRVAISTPIEVPLWRRCRLLRRSRVGKRVLRVLSKIVRQSVERERLGVRHGLLGPIPHNGLQIIWETRSISTMAPTPVEKDPWLRMVVLLGLTACIWCTCRPQGQVEHLMEEGQRVNL